MKSSSINPDFRTIPAPLRSQVEKDWEAYSRAAREQNVTVPDHPELLANLFLVWSLSEFVAQNCSRYPEMLSELLCSGDLLLAYPEHHYHQLIHQSICKADSEVNLARTLRQIRRREMTRIAWRDLSGWAPLQETLRDLSLLAEHLISATLDRLYLWQCKLLGTPWDEQRQRKQSLVVLAMGKLGAGELNFSSDIDLIFCYPDDGETRGKRPYISTTAFFTQLGQDLINILSSHTEDGWVYRVDMRLRPYGSSGPLVMSFDALEEYYQSQGREWERYAMIKARPVGSDLQQNSRLIEMLKPFIYRRYLDFSVLESLREMKIMINREVAKKELQENIKTGPGGIREIEFIGQVFQLIRGGREPGLQISGILQVLERLTQDGHLPEHVSQDLAHAYQFLRRTENRLQAWADEQVHHLPDGKVDQYRLALSMGYRDWTDFVHQLDYHRNHVQSHFEQVFEAPQLSVSNPGKNDNHYFLNSVWQGSVSEEEANQMLLDAGFSDSAESLRRIHALQQSHACRALSAQGRQRLDRLMPLLLHAASVSSAPDTTLIRLLDLIEAITRRTAYLSLLSENPLVLSQLVKLCAASPWISEMLTRHPVLLDELLDPRTLYAPLDRAALHNELQMLLERIPRQDHEQQLDTLRYFKQVNILRVATADVMDIIPLMVVSDHLTEIAEVTLTHVLSLAEQQLLDRKKIAPRGGAGKKSGAHFNKIKFGIIGYGKLGGIEMGYGSDLDLVFLHQARTTAEQEHYIRLGQRIIHILNTHTAAGVLYEVDMRLRPSGASGLLVSPIDAFYRYQEKEAWTWEHQALVRARFINGNPAIAQQFDDIRSTVLTHQRDPNSLRRDVNEMRQRMRDEFSHPRPGLFDIKHDHGGLADIEFIVQYGVLRWAHDHPKLIAHTDNVRLLEDFGRLGLMPGTETRHLSKTYRDYRKAIHRLVLQEQTAIIEDMAFKKDRQMVRTIWKKMLSD